MTTPSHPHSHPPSHVSPESRPIILVSDSATTEQQFVIKTETLPLPNFKRFFAVQDIIHRPFRRDAIHRQLLTSLPSTSGMGQWVALVGPANIGKTVIARDYVQSFVDKPTSYPGGVIWHTLGKTFDAEKDSLPLIKTWVELAYGDNIIALKGMTDYGLMQFDAPTVRQFLGNHEAMLVVLDDVWDAAVLEALRPALPNSAHVLITTQKAEVAALARTRLEIGPLEEEEAVKFIQQMLPEVPPQVSRALADILDGHPYAMTLAAGRVQQHDSAEWAEQAQVLVDELISRGADKWDARARLEDTRQLILGILPHTHQAMLEKLGTIGPVAANFDFEMAAALCGVSSDDTLVGLNAFTQQAILQHHVIDDTSYWSLNPEWRDDLEKNLGDALDEARLPYLAYVVDWLGQESVTLYQTGHPARPHVRFTGDHLTALVKAWYGIGPDEYAPGSDILLPEYGLDEFTAQCFKLMVQFVRALVPAIFEVETYASLPRETWLKAGILAAYAISDRTMLPMLWLYGNWRGKQGKANYDEARLALTYAQTLARSMAQADGANDDDKITAAWSAFHLGNLAVAADDPDAGLAHFNESLDLIRGVPDAQELSVQTANSLGTLYTLRMQNEQAIQLLEQAQYSLEDWMGQPHFSADFSDEEAALLGDGFHSHRQLYGTILQNIASCYLNLGQLENARRYLNQADRQWDVLTDPAHGYFLTNRAYLALMMGDWGGAEAALREGEKIADQTGDRRLRTSVLNQQGVVAMNRGDLNNAQEKFEASLAILEQLPDPRLQAYSLGNLGLIAYANGQAEIARGHLEASLSYLEHIRDANTLMLVLDQLGAIYHNKTELETGLQFFGDMLTRMQAVQQRGATVVCLRWLVIFAQADGAVSNLHEYTERIDCELTEIANPYERAVAEMLVAALNTTMGQPRQAVQRLESALAFWQANGNQPNQLRCVVQLADLHLALGEWQAARDYMDRAEPFVQEAADNPSGQVLFYQTKGRVAAEQHKPDEALESFRKAHEIARRLENPVLKLDTLSTLAIFYFGLGESGEMETTLEEGRAIADAEKLYAYQAHLHLISAALEASLMQNMALAVEHIQAGIKAMTEHNLTADAAGFSVQNYQEGLDWLLAENEDKPSLLFSNFIKSTSWLSAESLVLQSFDFLVNPPVIQLFRNESQRALVDGDPTLSRVLALYADVFANCLRRSGDERAILLKTTSKTSTGNYPSASAFLQNRHTIVSEAFRDIRLRGHDAMYHWWGRLYLHREVYLAALRNFNQAIDRKPEARYFVERGWANRCMGALDAARDDFETAIRKGDPRGYQGLGALAFEAGDYAEALKQLNDHLKVNSDDHTAEISDSYEWLGCTYQQLGDLPAARQNLDEAVRRSPRQSNYRYWRALLLLEMGDLQAAWDDLDFARRIDAIGTTSELPSPNTQRLIYDLIWQGVVCERMGRGSEANGLWNEAGELTEDKNGEEFRLAQALIGVLQGETADVVESRYTQILQNSPLPFLVGNQRRHLELLARLSPEDDRLSELIALLKESDAPTVKFEK